MDTIAAADITADTHIWVSGRLVYVENVRRTITGHVSINSGDLLLAADKTVTPAF